MNHIVIRRERLVSPKIAGHTRESLRNLARQHNVKRGQNTADTLRNLKAAGITIN
jgi:hypothetical protein